MRQQTALPAGYSFVAATKPRREFRCPTCRARGDSIQVYGHKDNHKRAGQPRRYLTVIQPCGCWTEAEVTE